MTEKKYQTDIQKFKDNIGDKGCLMGIDYGSVRIGIALSDEKRERATPFKIIAKMRELEDIVPAKNVVGFVIGLPLQTDGEEGKTAQQARLFAQRLVDLFHLPILWVDERYSSVESDTYLQEACFMRPENRKKVLDAHVAARLLEKAFSLMKV